MKIKEFVFAVQEHIQTSTNTEIKRSHIYELLSASFGYNSYAALCTEAVFINRALSIEHLQKYIKHLKNRCIDIGYQQDMANSIADILPTLLVKHEIRIIKLSKLISVLNFDEFEHDWDAYLDPILVDSLNMAADKGNAIAHYALAIIHEPKPGMKEGSEYWYILAQQGKDLSDEAKKRANDYVIWSKHQQKYRKHLGEAAFLGHKDAFNEFSQNFGWPPEDEEDMDVENIDSFEINHDINEMQDILDIEELLVEVVKSGHIDSMRQLIKEYDGINLQQCWTWLYFAELLGTDLTETEAIIVDERGNPYNPDNYYGPVYAYDGEPGIQLEPISKELEQVARQQAEELFSKITKLAKIR